MAIYFVTIFIKIAFFHSLEKIYLFLKIVTFYYISGIISTHFFNHVFYVLIPFLITKTFFFIRTSPTNKIPNNDHY